MTSTVTGTATSAWTTIGTRPVTGVGAPPITYPGPRGVSTAAGVLLDAMTAAGLDDPRWETAGPLVSAAALRLRQALGVPVLGTCVGTAPVVREHDLATAARGLLAREVHLADVAAAREFVRLALEAAVALS